MEQFANTVKTIFEWNKWKRYLYWFVVYTSFGIIQKQNNADDSDKDTDCKIIFDAIYLFFILEIENHFNFKYF